MDLSLERNFMKKTLLFTLLSLVLLVLLSACADGDYATLTYVVDGNEYHVDTLESEDDIFGQIGKEPVKGGFVFNGWYYDEGVWEKPLSYQELNGALASEDYRVYAKWENVDLKYNESTRSYTVVGLLLDAGNDIVIPKTYKSFPVTAIAEEAFRGNKTLTSIVIPDSVTTIGDYAFAECTALKELTIPNSVTSVGRGAFSNCISIKSAKISTALKELSAEMFFNCNQLGEVTLPKGLLKVGARSFASCTSLASLTIPFRVTAIGAEILMNTALTEITYGGSVSDFAQIDKDDFQKGSPIVTVHCTDGDVTL